MNTANQNEGAFGFLKFSVGTAGGTVPLKDVNVYIYTDPEGDDEGRLLYTLVTDEDGLTETVTLPTPPLAESFSPEYPKPYSTYNIFAVRDGYIPTGGRTVPLFPGITSIQPINLVPASDFAEGGGAL